MTNRASAVVACILSLHLANGAHAQESVSDPAFARYVHLMEANQFAEAFDLIIPAAGAGEPWAQREMTKLTEAVVYPKVHRPETIGPEYAEAMALLINRLQRGVEEGNAEAQYALGMKALFAEPTNRELARNLLTKAAKQNHKGAMDMLIVMGASNAKGVTSK